MNPPFSGWREGAQYYLPIYVAGIMLCIVLAPADLGWAGAPVLAAGVCVMLFFRDFPRTITAAENEVVAPADGTVTHVEDLETSDHYAGPCRRVSIFLSVFSVHVNRAPFACTVASVRYAPGKYIDARDPECAKVNESNALWLDTARGPMTVRQISGAVARRIVCPAEAGVSLRVGEKFGMIRFGSRTELYLPQTAEVLVRPGQKVRGGLTIVARFP